MSFRYGQRHSVELEAAKRVAERAGVVKRIGADIDLRVFGGSALTDDIAVPKGCDEEQMAEEIPPTYVPGRNTIFLSRHLRHLRAAVEGIPRDRDGFVEYLAVPA